MKTPEGCYFFGGFSIELTLQHFPDDIMQDPAVLVVGQLITGIDTT
ncbi:MAG: hypothetical protein KBE15_05605 [Budvicia sp.]|nr:hypothetical protein [Budvicia sp.]